MVLTTVTHLNGYVLRIHLAGQAEPLEPTNTHRLYSEGRDAWVPVGELTVGEHLRTLTGPAEITQIASRPGVHRVYNLEVETEHSYYVSTAGVLSHNENLCARTYSFWRGKRGSGKAGTGLSWDDAVDEIRGGADVVAADSSTAKALAEAASDGIPVWDPGHCGGPPHYHPVSGGQRTGGHVFY